MGYSNEMYRMGIAIREGRSVATCSTTARHFHAPLSRIESLSIIIFSPLFLPLFIIFFSYYTTRYTSEEEKAVVPSGLASGDFLTGHPPLTPIGPHLLV